MNDKQGTAPGQGVLGMPVPDGWTVERLVSLIAGGAILATLGLGRLRTPRWRAATGFVGVNLLSDAALGWCPVSVALHRLGVPTAAEQARKPE